MKKSFLGMGSDQKVQIINHLGVLPAVKWFDIAPPLYVYFICMCNILLWLLQMEALCKLTSGRIFYLKLVWSIRFILLTKSHDCNVLTRKNSAHTFICWVLPVIGKPFFNIILKFLHGNISSLPHAFWCHNAKCMVNYKI